MTGNNTNSVQTSCPGAWPVTGERLIVDGPTGSRLPYYRGRSCQVGQPSEQAHAAVAQPGALDRTVHLSFGDASGREYVIQLTCAAPASDAPPRLCRVRLHVHARG